MRPIRSDSWDAPNPDQQASENCFVRPWESNYGECKIRSKLYFG